MHPAQQPLQDSLTLDTRVLYWLLILSTRSKPLKCTSLIVLTAFAYLSLVHLWTICMTVYQRFPIHDPTVDMLGFMMLDILECHQVIASHHIFFHDMYPDTQITRI